MKGPGSVPALNPQRQPVPTSFLCILWDSLHTHTHTARPYCYANFNNTRCTANGFLKNNTFIIPRRAVQTSAVKRLGRITGLSRTGTLWLPPKTGLGCFLFGAILSHTLTNTSTNISASNTYVEPVDYFLFSACPPLSKVV
jgi:hypothetical protein